MKHKYLLYAIAVLLALNLIGVFSAILKQNQASIDIAKLKNDTEKQFNSLKNDLLKKADINITDSNYETLSQAAALLQKNASGELQRLHDRIDSAIESTNERMAQLEKNLTALRQVKEKISSESGIISVTNSAIKPDKKIKSVTPGLIKKATPTLESTLEELIQKEKMADATKTIEIPKGEQSINSATSNEKKP